MMKIMDATDLPNKRQRSQPRKSSTNTRALSTRITNIQKEINPYIRISGGTAQGLATTTYIDRKTQGEFLTSNGSLAVLASGLSSFIPDGAKILGMKVSNVTGRKISILIPGFSGLISNDGASTETNKDITRVAYAPLSRFPVLKVEIPDLVASNVDTAGTGAMFTLGTDDLNARVVIHFHYKQAI
jgi:hypothetical protein